MSLIQTGRFDPIAQAFGDAPGCKLCGSVPLRIEYARDLTKLVITVAIVCGKHHTIRDLDLRRVSSNHGSGNYTLLSALTTELHRVFDDVLKPGEPTTAFTQTIRRAITCGNCGAPSDPADPGCRFCGAHLAGGIH